MGALDRIKSAFLVLARGADPLIDYRGTYRAKLVKQHPNKRRVDVVPDDTRLPSMSNIPLKVGLPGADVQIAPGHIVLVGWENARPDRPYATLWDPGESGTVPIVLTVHAQTIQLGNASTIAPLDGVVTGQATEVITGLPMWMLGYASKSVSAKRF